MGEADRRVQLHADCDSRFASIRGKQEALREMDDAVSEGVVELERVGLLPFYRQEGARR